VTVERVAIVGLGLIGGSIGAALRRTGARVHGFDTSPQTRDLAVELGLIDQAHDSLPAALDGAQVVILAVPVQAIVDLLPTVDAVSKSDALILDTGSVKRPVVEVMATLAWSDRAIGGHPIAGRERSGPEAADPELFRGRPFVLTPSVHTSALTRARAERLARSLGALPGVLSAEEHDHTLARTSHLPQLLSTALALFTKPGDELLSGSGLRDMTRLAASDTIMWRDILLTNGDNVVRAAREYIDQFEYLVGMVDGGDPADLELTLDQGRMAADSLRPRVRS
jgi:prephenate dehydrogenase